MSKKAIKLTLVEMYAIKHGLEKALPDKRLQLELAVISKNPWKIEKLQKDVTHEEALIKRFEREIEEFRENNRINKPLTIEELRNMHDEIVWVKCEENKRLGYRFYSSIGKVNTKIERISESVGITVEIEVLDGIAKGDKWVDGAIEEGYIKVYRR